MKYAQELTKKKNVPQTKKLDKHQVKNNAGGFVYEMDDFKRLERFLILGTEGGTYYCDQHKHTKQAAKSLLRCIDLDGIRTVNMILDISNTGRAIKNDECIFALAMCFVKGEIETRKMASAVFNKIIRTGTHMFQFMDAIKAYKKSGRLLRTTISNWYNQEINKVTLQVLKYRNREGWTHLDVIRQAHPVPVDENHNRLFAYLAEDDRALLPNIHIADTYNAVLDASTVKEVAGIIDTHDHVPREFIPTEMLANSLVWERMLVNGMPLTAMIRNLGVMTSNGTINSMSPSLKYILDALRDKNAIKKSRVHPFSVLLALTTYAKGKGVKGSLTWKPISKITEALNDAFSLAFDNVEPTDKRIKISLDVSGSMFFKSSTIANTHITAGLAAAAMAKITAATEDFVIVTAFSNTLIPFPIGKYNSLKDITDAMEDINFGSTDCALPMLDAINKGQKIDAFIIYTDNETWSGSVHPMEALRRYRQISGINAKLVIVGMTSTKFSIADSNDRGCLDIVGFDANGPSIISNFIKGE